MDWYFVSSDELSDRFPSPESWAEWGISEPESFNFPNKVSAVDASLTQEELNFNGENLCSEVEMESSTYDKDQTSSTSTGGEFSAEFLHRTALSCDQLAYQLDGLAQFDQMDDLFLSSLIEDLPRTENVQDSFCFEPELENDMVHGDSILTDMNLDTPSISSDTQSVGSSKYLKIHAFSPSMEKEKISGLQFVPCNSEEKHCRLITAPHVEVLVPSEHDSIKENVDEETSLEESVLQEMEMVMSQLTDKTRICFRDALYRLAKNSRQNVVTKNQNGNLQLAISQWTDQDCKIRPREKKTMELETNTIDRAIANLMFNKMDINVHDYSVQRSTTSNQEILKTTRPRNYSVNEPQIHGLPCYSNYSRDAEGLILCQGHSPKRQFPT
ncbi:protein LNK3 [Ricinus communis]|uniref:protein LNK3 n=1 Tax=Ricinus communis TaxID=3988 RepID=UPI0007722044|nr:protein LNK3 [Ricinus communis]|eukprot:XP_015581370.1 protein LNK3 [Ricinus communis]